MDLTGSGKSSVYLVGGCVYSSLVIGFLLFAVPFTKVTCESLGCHT
jgi:hypothetical protein